MAAARRGAPEKQAQAAIKVLCRAMQWGWFDLSQPRATMQTAGLPDGILVVPGHLLMVEIKGPRGRQTGAQVLFEQSCRQAGVPYVVVRTAWELAEAVERLT